MLERVAKGLLTLCDLRNPDLIPNMTLGAALYLMVVYLAGRPRIRAELQALSGFIHRAAIHC